MDILIEPEAGPSPRKKLFDFDEPKLDSQQTDVVRETPEQSVDKPSNPFGLTRQGPTGSNPELTAQLEAQRLRTDQLRNGEIPIENMTESEKAAYLLKHLKD